ncbi:MAG TPA: endonuclease/exonuclease/phosphatase family protein [Candidatus Acidoferrales bacterium]|nr:endonuclease/exonuclease/phosphatase family protein [Candidatus Acidoferrales bacterium]
MHRDALEFTAAGARPTPLFPPVIVNRSGRHAGSRLRVVLLNAAGGRRFREILACLQRKPLAGADVILLCEVNAGLRRRAVGRDVAEELGAALGMSCAYVREFALRLTGSEIETYMGNAILSSAPFEDVAAIAMYNPRPPRVLPRRDRGVTRVGGPTGLITRVKFGAAEISIGVAHLHSRCTPAARARQMADYLESFPTAGRMIFGGDLNTTTTELSDRASMMTTVWQMITNPQRFRAPQAYEPLFDHLREHGLELDGVNVANRPTFTFSGLIPRSMRPKLDWLAVRDLRPIAGTASVLTPRSPILKRRVSDHDFVTVDLEL